MRWLPLIALCAVFLATAQDSRHKTDDGDEWFCARETRTAFGTVTVFRYVSLAGEQQGGGTNWSLDTPPQAIGLFGGWSPAIDREGGDGSILIDYGPLPAQGRYRIEVRRPGGRGVTLARSPLLMPEEGKVTFFADVSVMADAGSALLTLLVRDARGRVIRRDSFDAAAFRRLLPVLYDAQAPVEAMTAKYREACELVRRHREPLVMY